MSKVANLMIEGPLLGQASICVPLVRALSDWFGLEDSILNYEKEIENLPTLLAKADGQVLGFLSLKQHTPYSAEILVMAVQRDVQRCLALVTTNTRHFPIPELVVYQADENGQMSLRT